MPRQAIVRSIKGSAEPAQPAQAVKGPTLGETLVQSMASGAGSGIGFSVVNSFLRSTSVPATPPELCGQFDNEFRKCIIDRDDESCSKLWANYTKNGHKFCVQSSNK